MNRRGFLGLMLAGPLFAKAEFVPPMPATLPEAWRNYAWFWDVVIPAGTRINANEESNLYLGSPAKIARLSVNIPPNALFKDVEQICNSCSVAFKTKGSLHVEIPFSHCVNGIGISGAYSPLMNDQPAPDMQMWLPDGLLTLAIRTGRSFVLQGDMPLSVAIHGQKGVYPSYVPVGATV